jgi:hypothetical protein
VTRVPKIDLQSPTRLSERELFIIKLFVKRIVHENFLSVSLCCFFHLHCFISEIHSVFI